MTKLFSVLAIVPVAAASLRPAQTPAERAWLILQQGVTSKKAGARANAAHALRLLAHNARAEEMAERALADSNPKVRAADCLNPQAARSILPIVFLRARMVMAGRSKAEMVSAAKAGYENKHLPGLEGGAMDYMMSKSSYLTDQGGHNMPHLMFYTLVKDGKDWGSGATGSPVMSSPYWFLSPKEQPQMKGLPPILVFLVAVTNWSDGTPAG